MPKSDKDPCHTGGFNSILILKGSFTEVFYSYFRKIVLFFFLLCTSFLTFCVDFKNKKRKCTLKILNIRKEKRKILKGLVDIHEN